MSEAEQDDTGAVIAAEQAETATVSEAGPADESTRTGTVTEPSLAKEIKKQSVFREIYSSGSGCGMYKRKNTSGTLAPAAGFVRGFVKKPNVYL